MAFKRRWGLVGYIRGFEVSWSAYAGWHPHLHLLLYVAAERFSEPAQLAEFTDELRGRWLECLDAVGRAALYDRGVTVEDTDGAVADYLAKWGHDPSWDEAAELTKAQVKRGRGTQHFTPFQLILLAGEGEVWAAELVREYAAGMYRRQQLTPSKGLYELLKSGDEWESDDQVFERQEVLKVQVCSIASGAYRVVVKNEAVPELLMVLSTGSYRRVVEFFGLLGVSHRLILPPWVVVPTRKVKGKRNAPGV